MVSNKLVGPGRNSSCEAYVTGGGSHGVAFAFVFVQEIVRCFVSK